MYGVNKLFKSDIGEGGFYEVLPEKLTIDKAIPDAYYNSYCTLFKEVKLQPYKDDSQTIKHTKELACVRPVLHKGNWQKVIFEKFCDVVEENFTDNTVVGLSSGFDSRMIALAMVRRGLRPVEYVEGYGEWDGFMRVMELLKIKNYRIFNEGAKPNEHALPYITDPVTGFEGVVGVHLNVFYTPYLGHEGTQFTGCGANTVTEIMKSRSNYFSRAAGIKKQTNPGHRVRKVFNYAYYTQLNRYKIMGHPVRPFNDWGFIKTITKIKNWHIMNGRFSELILRAVSPDLAKIPRMDVRELTRRGFRTVSPQIMKDIEDRYKDSWYGRQVKSQPSDHLEYHQWWADWAASQICEKLIGKGFDIKF